MMLTFPLILGKKSKQSTLHHLSIIKLSFLTEHKKDPNYKIGVEYQIHNLMLLKHTTYQTTSSRFHDH